MASSQMIALINHVATYLGLAGGGALAVKASAKHVCWLVAVLVIYLLTDKTKRLDVVEKLPKL
jgi:hypothetical protein